MTQGATMAQRISLRKLKNPKKDPVFALQPRKTLKRYKLYDLGCHNGSANEFQKINKMQNDLVDALQSGKTFKKKEKF